MEDESSSGTQQDPCDCQSCPQYITILMDGSFDKGFLEYHASNYQELNPDIRIKLEVVPGDLEDFLKRLAAGGNDKSSSWDGTVFSAPTIGALMKENVLWDMTDYVKNSLELDWTEILPFYRYWQSGYDQRTRVVPLDGDVISMYYRKDLFQAYNMSVPRTWEEYNSAAKFFHGKTNRDGTKLFGSCVSRIDKCANEYWTSLILSSMTQSMGTSSGFFLDPDTANPLFGAAMEETLNLLAEQMSYGHTDELVGDCLSSNWVFDQGVCALTYNWGNHIIISDYSADVAVAPSPGSRRVLDRETGRLVDCTLALCPYGISYDDIGIVNSAPYAAFGGIAAGVSNSTLKGKQFAAADFFAYVSNNVQSLKDVLPNRRTTFIQPYRYSHVASSNWIDADFPPDLASEYTDAVRKVESENTVLELRVASTSSMKEVIDEEVFGFLMDKAASPDMSTDRDLNLRKEVTARMEERIQNMIASDVGFSSSYRTSLGYAYVDPEVSENYINENFRQAGWGLSGLMCVTALSLIVWTLRFRNNRVMKAFQPFLLIQSSVGLFLLGGTIIPLGFDDSIFDAATLDMTCMIAPWLYVCGFTIFFSSVYSKIQECLKIYKDPHKYDVLLVKPMSALHLCLRILIVNGTLLGLWTGIDPLRWERSVMEDGEVFEDGTIETYGACRGGIPSIVFALALYFLNMMLCLMGTLQSFKCRFLVLEYNEMQWLPLSLFPFLECWAIGGPIVVLVSDNPTVLFVVLSMIVIVGSVTAGMAVFAPKDWYIRKFRNSSDAVDKNMPPRKSSAGVLVLKHPTVESQKQLENLRSNLEQVEAFNTELEIEIRVMKDRVKELTKSAKFAVREKIFAEIADTDSPAHSRSRGGEELEHTEATPTNEDDLVAMEHFQQVWAMPDDEEEEDNPILPLRLSTNSMSVHSFVSDSKEAEEQRSGEFPVESTPVQRDTDDQSDISSLAAPQSPGSSRGSEYVPEDPLLRLERMAAELEEETLETNQPSVLPMPPDSDKKPRTIELRAPPSPSSTRGSDYVPEDPLLRLERMAAEEDEAEIYVVSEEPLVDSTLAHSDSHPHVNKLRAPPSPSSTRGSDYVPEDPLLRLERMAAEEEAKTNDVSEKLPVESSRVESDNQPRVSELQAPPSPSSSRGSDYVPEDPLLRLERMAAEEEEVETKVGGVTEERSIESARAPEDTTGQLGTSSLRAPPSPSSSRGSDYVPEDPLLRLERMAAEEEENEKNAMNEEDVAENFSVKSTPSPEDSDAQLGIRSLREPPSPSSRRGSDYVPEDPLLKLERLAAEEEAEEERKRMMKAASATLAIKARSAPRKRSSKSKRVVAENNSSVPEDPLLRLERMAAEEEEEEASRREDPLARLQRMVADEEVPEDPLLRLERMAAEEDESSVQEDPLLRLERMAPEEDGRDTMRRSTTKASSRNRTESQMSRLRPSQPNQIPNPSFGNSRLGSGQSAAEPTIRDENGRSSKQRGPRFTKVPSLNKQFEESDSEESDDVIIRKKDLRDLGSIIKAGNLEELETMASMLAASVKTKLTDTTFADFSVDESQVDRTHDEDYGSIFGIGRLAVLAEREGGVQKGINDLDISKISAEGDRNFVCISDSILDSPTRSMKSQGLTRRASSEDSNRSGSRSSGGVPVFLSAGESSAADVKGRLAMPRLDFASRYNDDGYLTQNAGEPSQGDWRKNDRKEYSNRTEGPYDEESPVLKPSMKNVPLSKNEEIVSSPEPDHSFSIDDWMAVGKVANVLADWSDSQSTSTFASHSDSVSVSSLEATTRASALDTPLANELDNLVGKMDWDGVKVAAEKFETSLEVELIRNNGFGGNDLGNSLLEEKRRKKRELEAWKSSLTRSMKKSQRLSM